MKIKVGLLAGIFTLVALGVSLVADRAQSASSDKVCFEAENAKTITPHFKKRTSPLKDKKNQVSSGGGVEIFPEKVNGDEKKDIFPGVVTYEVNLPSAGDYQFWARVYWGPEQGCSNSFWVIFNGGSPICFGEDGTYEKWHWLVLKNPARPRDNRYTLPQGKLQLALKNREDGIIIDQIFLTKGNVTPVGKMAVTPGALAH